MTAGSALLSVVLAGIALGWFGVLAVIAVLFVLLFVEIWREAAALVTELSRSQADLVSANRMAAPVPGLRSRVGELQALVQALEEEKRQPRASVEETLEALAIHLKRLELVLKHRAMRHEVPVIPVTRAMIEEDGTADLTGVVESGIDLLAGEPLVVVGGSGETGSEPGDLMRIESSEVQVRFALSGLPVNLAEEIEGQGSLSPTGYALCLAGLTLDEYKTQTDDDLKVMQALVKKVIQVLTRTLAGSSPIAEET